MYGERRDLLGDRGEQADRETSNTESHEAGRDSRTDQRRHEGGDGHEDKRLTLEAAPEWCEEEHPERVARLRQHGHDGGGASRQPEIGCQMAEESLIIIAVGDGRAGTNCQKADQSGR